tara:strand:- start:354 stop:608 length:255 start_codon:yes stop_codon:yes gene_type:complete
MKSKRLILFEAAKQDLGLDQTNARLNQSGVPEVTQYEYCMWQQSIVPLLQSNMFYYDQFIVTGELSVAGLVQSINQRRQNQVIS